MEPPPQSSGSGAVDTKVVVLGTQAVGKTSIVTRYVNRTFSSDVKMTIGAAFLTKTIAIDKYRVKMQLWDTAGQERFRSMAPMYYRGANAAILVYDITGTESFQELIAWVAELQKHEMHDCALFVVGNKTDLAENRRVPREQAQAYAAQVGAQYFETSAKADSGLNELFLAITRKLLDKHVSAQHRTSQPAPGPKLVVTPVVAQPQSSCC